MPRSALLLVAALIALLAVGGLFLFQSDGNVPDSAPPVPVATQDDSNALANEPAPGPKTPPTGLRERVTDAGETKAEVAMDATVAAAMAGFEGRVLNHDGSPAANSQVVLYRFDVDTVMGDVLDLIKPEAIEPDVDAGEATTDDEGRFRLTGVWPRSLYLLHAGLGTDNPTPMVVEQTPGPSEIVDLGDIVLANGAIVTGIVRDEEGKPVSGALVRVTDIPMEMLNIVPLQRFHPRGAVIITEGSQDIVVEMPAWIERRFEQLPIPSARTDSEGAFRVTGVQPGNCVVAVTKRDHLAILDAVGRLDAGEEKSAGELELRQGEEAFGRVVDTNGDPIVGAEVYVGQGGPMGGGYLAGPGVTTDSKGEFYATGFKSGKVVAAARRTSGDPWVLSEAIQVARDVLVTLPAQHHLTVRVTSEAGAEIRDPELSLYVGEPDEGALELARFGFRPPVELADRTERLEDGRHRFHNLNAGEYTLVVRDTGHAFSVTGVKLEGNQEVSVALAADNALIVRVNERGGKPVRAATVYANARGRERSERVGEMPLPVGRTSSDGTLRVEGMPPGTLRLSARHPAFGWAHAEVTTPGEMEAQLWLEPPGSVEGTLTEGGKVPTLGKWTVIATRSYDGVSRAMPEMPAMATPNKDGVFKFAGLQPGSYELQAIETFKRFRSPGTFFQTMSMAYMLNDGNETEVEVHSARTAHTSFDTERQPGVVDGPSARVSGTVLIDGRAAEGMVVTGWSQKRVSATVDATGRFDLGQVAEGHLWLQVVNTEQQFMGGSSLWSQSYQIEANQDITIAVDVTTATLSGVVLDATGNPADGVQVTVTGRLEDAGGAHSAANFGGITDKNGAFEFTGCPAGFYQVEARDDSRGRGVLSEVSLNAGNQYVEVRMARTVKVSGRVDLAALQAEKLRHGWISFHREGGGDEWEQISDDGTFSTDNMIPGTYKATMWLQPEGGENSQNYESSVDIIVGAQDVQGLVITPRLVQQEMEIR